MPDRDLDRMRREGCSDEEYVLLLDTVAVLQQRVAALEAALRELDDRMYGAHEADDGPDSAGHSCVLCHLVLPTVRAALTDDADGEGQP